MLGMFPAPKAATGEGKKASNKKDTAISGAEFREDFAILKGFKIALAISGLFEGRRLNTIDSSPH